MPKLCILYFKHEYLGSVASKAHKRRRSTIDVIEEDDAANADELSESNEDAIVDDLVRTLSDFSISSYPFAHRASAIVQRSSVRPASTNSLTRPKRSQTSTLLNVNNGVPEKLKGHKRRSSYSRLRIPGDPTGGVCLCFYLPLFDFNFERRVSGRTEGQTLYSHEARYFRNFLRLCCLIAGTFSKFRRAKFHGRCVRMQIGF